MKKDKTSITAIISMATVAFYAILWIGITAVTHISYSRKGEEKEIVEE